MSLLGRIYTLASTTFVVGIVNDLGESSLAAKRFQSSRRCHIRELIRRVI
jgi:hypothetical protein